MIKYKIKFKKKKPKDLAEVGSFSYVRVCEY